MTATATLTPGRLLRARTEEVLAVDEGLWGFGGLHGGLTAALLGSSMQRHVGEASALGSLRATFRRPLREPFTVQSHLVRAGRSVTWVAAQAEVDGVVAVTAQATFGRQDDLSLSVAPPAPAVDAPDVLDSFAVPRELAPFSQHVDVRPTDAKLPFSGGSDPTVTAWVRLVEDGEPPDLARLIMLVDALAPSVTAILDAPHPVPTVELDVRPARRPRLASPWVLVRARTLSIGAGGWIDERVDAWGADGTHLASATQLRLLLR